MPNNYHGGADRHSLRSLPANLSPSTNGSTSSYLILLTALAKADLIPH